MPKRGNADETSFSNSDERLNFALNLKEGLTPEAVIEDFGCLESDLRELPDSRTDVHASSEEEIERYYNECRPSGWTIKKQ